MQHTQIVSVRDAARVLGLTKGAVIYNLKVGRLAAVRRAGRHELLLSDVLRFRRLRAGERRGRPRTSKRVVLSREGAMA